MPCDAPVMTATFRSTLMTDSFFVRFRRYRRFGITGESGATRLMANLLDEGVADTLVSAASATLLQRRELAAQRANLLEPRGRIAQERSDAEKSPCIAAKCENRELDRDLSTVLVEGRHCQERAAAIAALGATHDLVVAFPMPTAQALGDDQIEPRANRLAFGKAEDPRGCRIPVADEARGVRVDHCIRVIGDEVLEKPGREFSAHEIWSAR